MPTKRFEIQQPESARRFQIVSSTGSAEPVELLTGELPTLDQIIKMMPTAYSQARSNRDDQKIIAYSRRSGTGAVINPGFNFRNLLASQEYYLVDTYPNATAAQHYRINSPAFGSIEFTIQLGIGILPGHELRAVENLARRGSVEEQLRDLMFDWVKQEVLAAGEMVFQNFSEFRARLSANLIAHANRMGVRLTALVYLKDDVPLTVARLDLIADNIRMQPFQYTDFVSMGFEAILLPDSTSESLTSIGLQKQAELQQQLAMWLQEFVRAQVTYNELITQLHTAVWQGLMVFWNNGLREAQKGWKVVELSLHLDDAVPETFRFERLDIEISLSNTRIKLNNTVILNLNDAQLYKTSRVPDLEAWTRLKLIEVSQNILATKTYAEVASQLHVFRDMIRTRLNEQALGIGYRVEYLITSDAISRFKPEFQFEFEEEEQDFQTTLDHVKLNVIVNGRIIDLNHETLKRYLTPETNLESVMKREVHRVVRQQVMRLNPHEFYTEFEEKIGPRLEAEIRNLLVTEFNVDDSVDIFPKWQDSYLLQRLRRLQQGFHYAEISYFNGSLQLKIKYSIEGVDPNSWPRFALRNFSNTQEEIASVSEELKMFVENMMQQKLAGLVAPNDPRMTQVAQAFAEEAAFLLQDNTGIRVRISGVQLVDNQLSTLIDSQRLEFLTEQISNWRRDIRGLDEKIRKKQDSGDDPGEIRKLQEHKSELERKLLGFGYHNNAFNFESDQATIDRVLGSGTSRPALNEGASGMDEGNQEDLQTP